MIHSVDRELLWWVLAGVGVPQKMIDRRYPPISQLHVGSRADGRDGECSGWFGVKETVATAGMYAATVALQRTFRGGETHRPVAFSRRVS